MSLVIIDLKNKNGGKSYVLLERLQTLRLTLGQSQRTGVKTFEGKQLVRNRNSLEEAKDDFIYAASEVPYRRTHSNRRVSKE